MPLSTSSFSATAPTGPRAVTIVAATILLITAIALLRPPSSAPANPDWFWSDKLTWHQEAAVILAGDSRVYRGLDPSEFEARQLGRTLNFGFSGGALDTPYLDAIERLIDPALPHPVIVLGVSPWSLTPRAATANGFRDATATKRSTPWPTHWSRYFAGVDDALRSALGPGRTNDTKETYRQIFHANGWVESDHFAPNPAQGLVVARIDHARENYVDSAAIDILAERIVRWRKMNWNVFVVRIPGEFSADQLAEQLSGWSESTAHNTLSAAGAIWLTPSIEPLFSYDGVHLDSSSARRLSAALATEISERLPSRSPR